MNLVSIHTSAPAKSQITYDITTDYFGAAVIPNVYSTTILGSVIDKGALDDAWRSINNEYTSTLVIVISTIISIACCDRKSIQNGCFINSIISANDMVAIII